MSSHYGTITGPTLSDDDRGARQAQLTIRILPSKETRGLVNMVYGMSETFIGGYRCRTVRVRITKRASKMTIPWVYSCSSEYRHSIANKLVKALPSREPHSLFAKRTPCLDCLWHHVEYVSDQRLHEPYPTCGVVRYPTSRIAVFVEAI